MPCSAGKELGAWERAPQPEPTTDRKRRDSATVDRLDRIEAKVNRLLRHAGMEP